MQNASFQLLLKSILVKKKITMKKMEKIAMMMKTLMEKIAMMMKTLMEKIAMMMKTLIKALMEKIATIS